jgi:hypothetical protein
MSDAKTELLLVKEKIKGLKAEYCWYFEQLHKRYPRWIYSQYLGVEAMKGLVNKLKLEYGWNSKI